MTATTWWLISNEDAAQVRSALLHAQSVQDERCDDTGCLCDLSGERCSTVYADALHSLESGLHLTDAVPEDWQGEDYSTSEFDTP